jgi:hypothetical protein
VSRKVREVISLVLEPIDGQPLTAALNRPIYVKFPVNFPVSREFRRETGSPVTASSASESGLWGVISRWGRIADIPAG